MTEQSVSVNKRKQTKMLHYIEPHKTKCKVFIIHLVCDLVALTRTSLIYFFNSINNNCVQFDS